MNVCSYHLQEAGATPEQELAFALATARAVLDEVRGQVEPQDFPEVVSRISFFVNAGIRFVTEMCKMRAFVELWDEICRDDYGVDRPEAPPLPLRRAGQLARPDRAAAGEQRLPHPDRDARRHPLEERPRPRRPAPGLERGARPAPPLGPAMVAPDAADHGLRDRPARIRRPLRRQPRRRRQGRGAEGRRPRRARPDRRDGRRRRRHRLHEVRARRRQHRPARPHRGRRDHRRRRQPLHRSRALAAHRRRGRHPRRRPRRRGRAGRPPRTPGAPPATPPPSTAALAALAAAARAGANVMPASIAAAKAGVTTGEWGAAMREVFGEYRAPTGVGKAAAAPAGNLAEVRAAVEAASARIGRRIKFLVGKPGLDGHSNGAEQIAVRARDCGMEVLYEGIRLTPAQIVNAALEESVHVVGLSILSGSHLPLVTEIMRADARRRPRRHPRRRRRHHPRRRRRDAPRRRRRPRLHAEGLRAEPDHARHRRPRRRRTPARPPDAPRAPAPSPRLAGGSAAAQDVQSLLAQTLGAGRRSALRWLPGLHRPGTRRARRSASPTSRSRSLRRQRRPRASGHYANGAAAASASSAR